MITVPHIPEWNPLWSETRWHHALGERLDALEFEIVLDEPRGVLQNLALDVTQLYEVAEGRRKPVFRLWDWAERAVILGSYQSVSSEIDLQAAEAHGFFFARRMSGGGAMVVEPGRTITWSVIVPEQVVEGLSFVQSFAFLDAWAVRALRAAGVPVVYKPVNDIATAEGKVSGAAQCRRKHTVLHHVTMAWELDDAFMFDLLRLHAPRQEARSVASAVKHVAPLSHYLRTTREEAMQFLSDAFMRMHTSLLSSVTQDELVRAEALIAEKLGTREWLYRVG